MSLLLFSPITPAALDPGYFNPVFQTEQGLPQNTVNAIIESRDGYLWIATLGGLARFDGARFKVFDSGNTPQLPNNRITALAQDDNGAIWIGHETGDLTLYRDDEFQSVAIPGASIREPIISITTDTHGSPLVFYESGALRFVQSGERLDTGISPEQRRGEAICVRDGAGVIWVLRSGSLSKLIDNKLQPVEFDPFTADKLIDGIAAARDGGLWVASQGGIRKRIGGQWTQEVRPIFWRPTFIPAMLEMRDGTLAVGTLDRGIYLLSTNSLHRFERNDAFPIDFVRTLCEDHEGNLWTGLASGGMVGLRPARAGRLNPPDRWKDRPVVSVTPSARGGFWIGTEGAGLYANSGGRWTTYGVEDGLPNAIIRSVAEDETNRLWVSLANGGVYVLNGEKFQPAPNLEDLSAPVHVIFKSSAHHSLFLGSRAGLFEYDHGSTKSFSTNLIAADVRCVTEQTNGVVWFGMFGGGLGRLENGQAKQFRKPDGLSSDFVQALYVDDENTLWIGTAESGLSRFKNEKFASVTTAHGLRDNVICHIADDRLGHLWISSHRGIMRIAKADLNACADGSRQSFDCVWYGETDGLPSAQCAGGLQPTGCRTPDGNLWFATVKGIAGIDPSNVHTNPIPLVRIEQFRVNDIGINISSQSAPSAKSAVNSLQIPPGRQRFDFDYTAITFAAPDRVLFKYRLEGLEQDWVGPTAKRNVSYSYLTPGPYTFRLIACNSDGAWTETGAVLAFTVLPFFYQTLAFRAATIFIAIALAGAAALLVARARYKRQLELAETQRGIERERARISQDIHDDLGSSLTRILLLSQSARGDLDNPELAASDLDRIYDTARNLTRSLDEIVWAVNPRHDTLDSLATYLGKFAQDFLGAANIRCRLDLPVNLPAWPLRAETRHNVFLAFKEALNNAVKHAQATEVKITLTLEHAAFTLSVADNGRGLPENPQPSADDTEDGLINMRKRLAETGGRCEIQSQPGQGTNVTFHVPTNPG